MGDPIIDIHVHFGVPMDSQRKKESLELIGTPATYHSLISWRLEDANENPGLRNWTLPLEIGVELKDETLEIRAGEIIAALDEGQSIWPASYISSAEDDPIDF